MVSFENGKVQTFILNSQTRTGIRIYVWVVEKRGEAGAQENVTLVL